MGGYYQTSALFWVVFVTLLQYSQGKPNNKIVCLPKNLIKTLALGILLVCQNMFRDKAWRDLENLSEFVIKMQK